MAFFFFSESLCGAKNRESDSLTKLRPKKGLIFSKSGRLLEAGLEIGPIQEIPEPCSVPKKVRQLLEMHCYVHTTKFVNLAKYQYILTNNKVKFGDFHALMPAHFGKAAHDPDAYLKTLKNEAKELDMQSQAQWPRSWSALPKMSKQRCLRWSLQEAAKRSSR